MHFNKLIDRSCGSGILCALLHRSSPSSKILGIDHFPNLAALSKSNLQSDGIPLSEHLKPGHVTIQNINYHDLTSQLSDLNIPGFDMIAFGCSPSSIPAGIVDVLLEGGRCVVPVGTRMKQRYTLLTKCRDVRSGKFELKVETLDDFGYCRFVPLLNNCVDYGERYRRKWCYGKKMCSAVGRFVNGKKGEGEFLETGPRVIDLGGGYGRNVKGFYEGGCGCTVVDECEEGLVKGEKWFESEAGEGGEGKVKFVKGDGNEIKGKWDVVICCYFDGCDFEKAWEKVRVGGYLIVEGFSDLHMDLPLGPSKSNLIDPSELLKKLVGSKTVHFDNRVRKLNEGTHHRFKAAGTFEGIFRKPWDWSGDRSEIIWQRVNEREEEGEVERGRIEIDFDVRVIKHVQAMHRSTSTTKNFDGIVVGEPRWRNKVNDILDGESASSAAVTAYCLFEGGDMSVQDFRDIPSEEKVLLVPDGSIEQAAKVYEYLGLGKARTVSIEQKEVEEYDSKLISFLHRSAGKGRLSTAEAIGFVGNKVACEREVEKIIGQLKKADDGGGGRAKLKAIGEEERRWPSVSVDDLVEYSKCNVVGATVPFGLRECVLCGCTLSNWKRRNDHFRGKKHCGNVLKFCEGEGVEEIWGKGEETIGFGFVEEIDRVTEMLEMEEEEKERGGEKRKGENL
ncbi:hypothetical protein TrST_g3723 [Triparma strigata]|uniref:protein-L-isoaspartate(D-aspartate) O-methyltransferase n=1 Tax=Triparma strigata TaxID=1606541 RepID=A0A9W6ZPF7_9STRA|nr:hypothetical protein TrST_g3723 [Triparma strigata]